LCSRPEGPSSPAASTLSSSIEAPSSPTPLVPPTAAMGPSQVAPARPTALPSFLAAVPSKMAISRPNLTRMLVYLLKESWGF
jgi:hypothetical protein